MFSPSTDAACRRECCEVLSERVGALENKQAKVCIPRPQHLMQRNPGMRYQFRPEIHVQIQGATRFHFPTEELVLLPRDIAIVPAGLPYAERACAGDTASRFRKMVVGFHSNSVSMHLAVDSGTGGPEVETIQFYSTPHLSRIVGQADYMVQLRHSGGAHSEIAVRGIGLALLGVLADLSHMETPDARQESRRIFLIKWLVRDHLNSPELNVTFLANRLECSPDYLSFVFHKETRETLIHYINRQRMKGALGVLDNDSVLTISEIAWACGFVDAGYFTRVFRKHTGLTPLNYRKRRFQENQSEEDALPKVRGNESEKATAGERGFPQCLAS